MRIDRAVSCSRVALISTIIFVSTGLLRPNIVLANPACTTIGTSILPRGVAVAAAGDANSDGYADVVIGATSESITSVISGKDGTNLFDLVSTHENDQFGHSVSGVSDLNGDGIADILVGAPSSTDLFQYGGRVDVFDGQTGALLYSVVSPSPGALFGSDVSGIGDINNDGSGDFIVGAPENSTESVFPDFGDAYVYSGIDGSLIYSYAGSDQFFAFGRSVAGVGDVDGDGTFDFAIGQNITGFRSVSVYSGSTGSKLHDLVALEAADQFGASIARAGDLNLDGFDDILVGAPNSSITGPADGQAYVFSGLTGETLFTLAPDTSFSPFSFEFFGNSVAGGKDINGDGFPDIVIGAHLAADDAGKAYVFSGADQSKIGVFTGVEGQKHGWSVALTGDINGDCLSDIAVIENSRTFLYSFQNSCARPATCLGCCNLPGDANNDGSFNIADVSFGIARIFSGGAAPSCQDEADANGDSNFNISDIVFGVARIFTRGPSPVCGTGGF